MFLLIQLKSENNPFFNKCNKKRVPPPPHFYIPPIEVPVILLLVRVAEVSDTVEDWLLVTAEAVSEACSEVDGLELLVEALVVCDSILAEVVGTTVGSIKYKMFSQHFNTN